MDYTYYDELGGYCRQPRYLRPTTHNARVEPSSRVVMRVKYRMWRERCVRQELVAQIVVRYASTPRRGPSVFEEMWRGNLQTRLINDAAQDIAELEGQRFAEIAAVTYGRTR